ncbi:hypothetical protein BN136_3536 [Cronobacter universalis NCTC 9529]|nr:hypothetical protein BN136_3536 [Cronobacter universalis NCTC 9529]
MLDLFGQAQKHSFRTFGNFRQLLLIIHHKTHCMQDLLI